jgi:2-polyprenyl-6-methoxyphenol hydroxylase-like FAD-dependent oxidoreductase
MSTNLTDSSIEPITIIGGGIGGLAFANALQKVGIDYRIYEQAPQITEVGAAIGISKAALDIFGHLGLKEQAQNEGFEIQEIFFSDKNLRTIRTIKTEWPSVIIHRAKLISILASNIPKDKIELNAKLIEIKNYPDLSILRFANGVELKSKCTVIADGIHSVSRKQLFPELKIRYAGQTIWRGISAMTLPETHAKAYTEIWGNNRRFLFGPMNSEHIAWLAIKNQTIGGVDNPGTVRQELIRDHQDYHPIINNLLINSSNFIRTDIADLGTIKRKWFLNKIVFLGDAIHATTPNLAQGGCQAIEDAYCLSLLMAKSNRNYSSIFPTYQKLREDKVSFVVNTSWSLGKIAHNTFLSQLGKYFFEYAPERVLRKSEQRLNDLNYLHVIN